MYQKHYHRVLTTAALTLILSGLACSAPSAALTSTPGITEIFPLPNTVVPATPTGESTPVPAGPSLTVDQLKNATYQVPIVPSGIATLVDGHYSEPNPELGGDTGVDLLEPVSFGDINGDGVEDALVRLFVQTGSTTGRFSYLFAMLNQNGGPQQAAFTWLGDRIILNAITVNAGEITVDMVISGPNDAACCPNTPAIQTYRLEGSELVQFVGGATVTPVTPPLNYDMLKNLTYHDVHVPGETFTLADGLFSEPTDIGTLSISLANWIPFGDLDGDGVQDVATVLVANTAGTTGQFYYLVAVRNNGGAPEHVATQFLGDRVVINSMSIDAG